ncbi:MAG: sugar phosphate isomerase/epimerase [Erysipelotrichaceae bacterium]|nr:sugar phosphate isomerase/epimerase [Erysipelotrichaceae bacterium]
MKKGIYSWFGYPVAFDDRMAMIKNAGFETVMLWWGDEREAVDGSKFLQPEIVKKHGLTIENVHLPFDGIGILWQDTNEANLYEAKIIKQIEEIAAFDVDTVIMHITNGSKLPTLSDVMLNRIKRINEVAKKHNIRLALENLKVIGALDFILDNIKDENVGFCYDSGHHNCYCWDQDLLKRYKDRLFAIHLHDNDSTSDMHKLPYDGTIDWDYVYNGIVSSIYDRSLTLELEGNKSVMYHHLSPEAFLNESMQRLLRLDK